MKYILIDDEEKERDDFQIVKPNLSYLFSGMCSIVVFSPIIDFDIAHQFKMWRIGRKLRWWPMAALLLHFDWFWTMSC